MKRYPFASEPCFMKEHWLQLCGSLLQESRTANYTPKTKRPLMQKTRYYKLEKKPSTISLSEREAQCVVLFLEGYTNPEAAKKLNLSARTIEFYLNNIKKKLKCRCKKEIVEKIQSYHDFMLQRPMIKKTMCVKQHRNKQ